MIGKNFSVRRLFVLLLLLIGQANCFVLAQSRKVKFDETFTLQPDETAETEDAKLKIRLSGVGREISESGEVEYAELQVKTNGAEQKIVIRERGDRTRNVGGYIIELINAESFGKTNCQLKISRGSKSRRRADNDFDGAVLFRNNYQFLN